MSGCKDIFNVIKLSLIFMQRNLVALTPCVKFRKYFEMRQCQKRRFKVLPWKSMRIFLKVF